MFVFFIHNNKVKLFDLDARNDAHVQKRQLRKLFRRLFTLMAKPFLFTIRIITCMPYIFTHLHII